MSIEIVYVEMTGTSKKKPYFTLTKNESNLKKKKVEALQIKREKRSIDAIKFIPEYVVFRTRQSEPLRWHP
jgi:hypothetical protein